MSLLKLFLDDANHSLVEILVLFSFLLPSSSGLSLGPGVHHLLVLLLLSIGQAIGSKLLRLVLRPHHLLLFRASGTIILRVNVVDNLSCTVSSQEVRRSL